MAKDNSENLIKKIEAVQQKEEKLGKLVRSTSERAKYLKGRNQIWAAPLQKSKSDGFPAENEINNIENIKKEEDKEEDPDTKFQPQN